MPDATTAKSAVMQANRNVIGRFRATSLAVALAGSCGRHRQDRREKATRCMDQAHTMPLGLGGYAMVVVSGYARVSASWSIAGAFGSCRRAQPPAFSERSA